MPTYGKTGIKSSTTTGNVYSSGNSSFVNNTTTYDYSYGITGYTNTNITVFTRVLLLSSYDLKQYREKNELLQLWETQIVSTGSNNDLREVLPYLIAASEDFIGKDTKKQVRIVIKKNNSKVLKYLQN